MSARMNAGAVFSCTQLFAQAEPAALVEMVTGVADPFEYASLELANRELDSKGRRIGASQAEAAHILRMASRRRSLSRGTAR